MSVVDGNLLYRYFHDDRHVNCYYDCDVEFLWKIKFDINSNSNSMW